MTELSTVYGTLSVPETPDDLIVRSLRLHGEWAFAEPLLLGPLVKGGDRIWDVGAYLGTFGLGLVQLARDKPESLLSLEPNAEVLPHLRFNLQQNTTCPFRTAGDVVGADGVLLERRTSAEENNAGSIGYQPNPQGILSRSLASLRDEFSDYDVLKLDIEGLEATAIRGDVDYLRRRQPVIWAECNEAQSSFLLLEALVSLGYKPLFVAFPAFRKMNFQNSLEKIFPLAFEAALLAAPPERLKFFSGIVEGEEVLVYTVTTLDDLRKALFSTPRWAMPQWAEAPRAELIALLGRMYMKQELGDFLLPTPPAGD